MDKIVIENLSLPLSENAPAGENLRESRGEGLALYHNLKDLRHGVRLEESQAAMMEESHFIKSANWEPIISQCCTLLTQHSKDLEVASWLVEALVRVSSFEGLSNGFQIITSLVNKFSTKLHPQWKDSSISEQDWSYTLSFLGGIAGQSEFDDAIFIPIRFAPFTQNKKFSLWQFLQATELENIRDDKLKEEKLKNGSVLMEQIKEDILESDIPFLIKTKEAIENSLHSLKELSQAVDAHFKSNAISFSATTRILTECQRAFLYLAGDRLERYQEKQKEASSIITNNQEPEASIDLSFKSNRTSAGFSLPVLEVLQDENNHYSELQKQLAEINFDCIVNPQKYSAPVLRQHTVSLIRYLSELVKLTDNHSSLPYFLDKAVSMSKLSFAEVLSELNLSPEGISVKLFPN